MSSMTRSMTSGEVELLHERRTQLKRGVRRCIERMSMPASACLGVVLLGAYIAITEGVMLPLLIGLALVPVAILLSAAWYWRELNDRRQPVRECEATISRGQVIEERYEAVRLAALNLGISDEPGVGIVEHADYFYDLGDGRVVFVKSRRNPHDDHAFGSELKLVYTAGQKMPLSISTTGEPLAMIHGETDQPIDLPNGTILPGGLDAVLAALGARMID